MFPFVLSASPGNQGYICYLDADVKDALNTVFVKHRFYAYHLPLLYLYLHFNICSSLLSFNIVWILRPPFFSLCRASGWSAEAPGHWPYHQHPECPMGGRRGQCAPVQDLLCAHRWRSWGSGRLGHLLPITTESHYGMHTLSLSHLLSNAAKYKHQYTDTSQIHSDNQTYLQNTTPLPDLFSLFLIVFYDVFPNFI